MLKTILIFNIKGLNVDSLQLIRVDVDTKVKGRAKNGKTGKIFTNQQKGEYYPVRTECLRTTDLGGQT